MSVLKTKQGLTGPPFPGAILAKISTEGKNFGRYYYYGYDEQMKFVFLGYADPRFVSKQQKEALKEDEDVETFS